jgi:hypothetical protein
MNLRPLIVLMVGLGGCGGRAPADHAKAADTLSTRERQEALGKSAIPGAGGVNRALDIVDTAAVRNQRLDSIGQ